MADNTTERGPQSVTVPYNVTVDTSGTIPIAVDNIHSLSASQAGFTRISKFTFSSNISGMQEFDPKVSNNTLAWDFGDGYSLSAGEHTTAEHRYQVPGVYTVSHYHYDKDGQAVINTITKSISVFNYVQTDVRIDTTYTKETTGAAVSSYQGSKKVAAGSKDTTFIAGVSTSWQDIEPDGKYTLYLTASGSKAKPYDTKNKYAHLIPYNAFYNAKDGDLIDSINGLKFELNDQYYVVDPGDNKVKPIYIDSVEYFQDIGIKPYLLGATVDDTQSFNRVSTDATGVTALSGTKRPSRKPVQFIYYDDIPNVDPGVNLLFKIDTSKHKVKNFYVDELEGDINTSGLNYLETSPPGKYTQHSPTTAAAVAAATIVGYPIVITKPAVAQISFTSTGMKEMSGINYKRQGDKFQLFVSLADKSMNILKLFPNFKWSSTLASDYSFHATWASGGDLHTTNISSVSTNKFPYNTSTSKTELSSFLYVNIDPLSAGTWTLNVTGLVPTLSTQSALSGFGTGNVGYGNTGNTGDIGIGVDNANHITSSYTFTICPSTNDNELYKINEHIDYSQTIKSYRFQSFLHEYDNLFDGIFTSFVGEASSSPTVFGKTVFEKIANFVANNNDVDYCNLDNLQSFYDFFNEDIDIVLPTPPPELKRLYDLFSIKITKLLGDYEQDQLRLNSNFYTNSADGRNVDFDNPISVSTYTVTAYTNFVARQRFNNEFVLITPQKIATKHVDGSSSGESTTYPLSTYNVYSNWGWLLDTSVSGTNLDKFYDFYPFTTYDSTSSTKNIKNSIIDFDNEYTSITRSSSSLSANWDNTGGIVYKNVDYQIRKGLNIWQ